MKRMFLVILVAAALNAQTAKFDAASLKLHPGIINYSSDPHIQGRRVRGTASSLKDLITTAYQVRDDQVMGLPKWADSDHYDLDAASEGDGVLTGPQMREMLQNLLADRFQLKAPFETADRPMFALVVAKGDPKLGSPVDDHVGYTRGDAKGIHIEQHQGTMHQLADKLSYYAGHPVEDRTGLSGEFSYKLEFIPGTNPNPPEDSVDLFQALQQQLGLKLEPARDPLKKLVVDHAEKPSEN